jgi:hypothetical protein
MFPSCLQFAQLLLLFFTRLNPSQQSTNWFAVPALEVWTFLSSEGRQSHISLSSAANLEILRPLRSISTAHRPSAGFIPNIQATFKHLHLQTRLIVNIAFGPAPSNASQLDRYPPLKNRSFLTTCHDSNGFPFVSYSLTNPSCDLRVLCHL